MPLPAVPSNTGGTTLPPVGTLSYNGIQFSCLYASKASGAIIQDAAERTTKIVEWTLEVDGVVTLNDGDISTDQTWRNIRDLLSVHAAPLIYQGNGFGNLNVNVPGGNVWDIKWGPVPKILDFKPFGPFGASIKWQVTVWIPQLQYSSLGAANPVPLPGDTVAQFNYEAGVSYDDAGYSKLSVKGTFEVAMTRQVFGINQDRAIKATVDDFREIWLNIQIDLVNFKITGRDFQFSRDKRTCEWNFNAEEIPPCGLPWGATAARGSMTVRQVGKNKLAFIRWQCTLQATYTIRGDFPRRTAALNFYSLLWFRMQSSANGDLPGLFQKANVPHQQNLAPDPIEFQFTGATLRTGGPLPPAANFFNTSMTQEQQAALAVNPTSKRTAILNDFGFTEGIYEDGKTMTFTASWLLFVRLQDILRASGVWRFPNVDTGGQVYADSIARVVGPRSWLLNKLNPKADVVVDLGGGTPQDELIFIKERNTSLGGNPPSNSSNNRFQLQ